jgi:hypothetical protein
LTFAVVGKTLPNGRLGDERRQSASRQAGLHP